MKGRLVLVGTPLGNREDLSPRARRAIETADLLFCEDTRSPQRLLGEGAELPPRRSCFVGNEADRIEGLLDALARGQQVAYVSEAGLPVWSDPGRLLVQAAVAAGFDVDVIPGPTAASVALCLSGFEPRGARFHGFLPRERSPRSAALRGIAEDEGVALIYEAGNRTPTLLAELASQPELSARAVVVARELTKLHQEVLRGTASELAVAVVEPLRGEVTVVVDGRPVLPKEEAAEDPAQVAARRAVEILLDEALKPRQKAKQLAALTGLQSKQLYDRLSRG